MTPRVYATTIVALIVAACGGGSSGEGDEPPAGTTTPPVGQAPEPAPAPGTTPPPSGEPPAAQPPAGQPPVAEPPAVPPPVAGPPAAGPPADPWPTLAGKDFAYLMNGFNQTFPGRFTPLPQKGYTASTPCCDSEYIAPPLGAVSSYQIVGLGDGLYRFKTGQVQEPTAPDWYYKSVDFELAMSAQDGQIRFGEDMRMQIHFSQNADLSVNYEHEVTLVRQEGVYIVNPEDRLPQDKGSLATWVIPDTPYFMELQTGLYEGRVRNCWHMSLPGDVKRRNCMLYRAISPDESRNEEGWAYGGDVVDDYSHPTYGPVTFLYLNDPPSLPSAPSAGVNSE